jgi:hypothetical protein
MKIARILLIALLAGLSTATWRSQASAAGRDEAISRCIAQAKMKYRGHRGKATGEYRTFSYLACMHSAGFPP